VLSLNVQAPFGLRRDDLIVKTCSRKSSGRDSMRTTRGRRDALLTSRLPVGHPLT
jgi:hypothetical protein